MIQINQELEQLRNVPAPELEYLRHLLDAARFGAGVTACDTELAARLSGTPVTVMLTCTFADMFQAAKFMKEHILAPSLTLFESGIKAVADGDKERADALKKASIALGEMVTTVANASLPGPLRAAYWAQLYSRMGVDLPADIAGTPKEWN
jgi:hypothetical protein